MPSMIKRVGRAELILEWKNIGDDNVVILRGGDEHIGATGFAYYDRSRDRVFTDILKSPGHRETEIAYDGAKQISGVTKTTTVFIAGIHLDNITKSEIRDIVNISYQMIDDLAAIMEERA